MEAEWVNNDGNIVRTRLVLGDGAETKNKGLGRGRSILLSPHAL